MNRFAETYSGFCLIQYFLDIKDRNNANIMIRKDGSVFHIDLAFIFGTSPGGIGLESVPFKMTKEYIKVLGGFDSDCFRKF
jgi:phosphatidylinositol kinase/protein kinase (PI-3  family)